MLYDHTYNNKQTTGRRQLNQIDNEVEPNIEEQADLLRLEQTWVGSNTVFDMRLRVTFLRRKTVSFQSNIAHRE